MFSTAPELWEKYCSFCLETMNTNYSISEVRSIFEQALTAVGLHVSKADIIWKLYRDFENSLRESAQVTTLIFLQFKHVF
jgi:hypothetical protein